MLEGGSDGLEEELGVEKEAERNDIQKLIKMMEKMGCMCHGVWVVNR